MDQKELHGGSHHWWPPAGDQIFLYKLNPVRFKHFDRFLWMDGTGLKCLMWAAAAGMPVNSWPSAGPWFSERISWPNPSSRLVNMPGKTIWISSTMQCRVEKLPFSDQTMDAVTCFDVLEHIPDKGRTLGEIHRVLKPGGWLFFDTFNKTFWSKLFIIWLGEILLRFMRRGIHDWSLFILPGELRVLLENLGFPNMELAGVKFNRHSHGKGDFPAFISSKGNTKIDHVFRGSQETDFGRQPIGQFRGNGMTGARIK